MKIVDEEEADDLISRLPDDILIHMLSSLWFEEVIATARLSKRWRYLWKSAASLRIRFPSHFRFPSYFRDMRNIVFQRKFIKFFNGLMLAFDSHRRVKELRIHWLGDDIDNAGMVFIFLAARVPETWLSGFPNWLEFVSAKRIEILELDFRPNFVILNPHSSAKVLSIMYHRFPAAFGSLKELILKGLQFSTEFVDYFLSNSPSLERLSIQNCCILGDLKVVGPSLALKYLEVRDCDELESLLIADVTTLTQLICTGLSVEWCLVDVPSLVEVHVDEPLLSPSFRNCYENMSSCFSRLETLTVEIRSFISSNSNTSFELPRLKKLVLRNSKTSDDLQLFQYMTRLIGCSPLLKKLVLQKMFTKPSNNKPWELQHDKKSPHRHLEEVEFSDYYGWKSDLELVSYFIESIISLKKIIICFHDLTSKSLFRMDKPGVELERTNGLRLAGSELAMRALQDLQKLLPSSLLLEFRCHHN